MFLIVMCFTAKFCSFSLCSKLLLSTFPLIIPHTKSSSAHDYPNKSQQWQSPSLCTSDSEKRHNILVLSSNITFFPLRRVKMLPRMENWILQVKKLVWSGWKHLLHCFSKCAHKPETNIVGVHSQFVVADLQTLGFQQRQFKLQI